MFVEYRLRFEPDGVLLSQRIEASDPYAAAGALGGNPPEVPGGNPPEVPGGNPPEVPGGNAGALGGNFAGGNSAGRSVADSNVGTGGGSYNQDVAVILGPVIFRQPSRTAGLPVKRSLTRIPPKQSGGKRSLPNTAADPVQLLFKIQPQERDNWCWAAIAVSVADSFSHPARTPDSQCRVATRVLGVGNCCPSGQAPDASDVPLPLETALRAAGVPPRLTTGPLANFDAVTAEIDQNKPFCVRIGPSKGKLGIGHFLVVHGYWRAPSGKNYLILSDPNGGTRRRMEIDEFRNNFHLEGKTLGTWTHTYLF